MAILEYVQGVAARSASLSIVAIALLVYLILICLLSPQRPCEIVLTGESISIRNCEMSRDLIESLQSLKMTNNCIL
ncbi:Triple gene block protein 3 [Papaya mild mottle associated virus]|uniref:Movement protein TGBp3 n=1 Tax=Papaya mild mottle associated virus TaxID=2716617 RepID=A0AAE6X4V8_9VIRU|nr:Triple gene block protein 3 [Papaya mild mottle associated virus]QIJ97075.1 Triple gene block protein 3 [Papaya mild mottle associated virus]